MDLVIDKELQILIDNNLGDIQRLEFIRKSLREEKKISKSDQKYLMKLLKEHSKVKNVLKRLDYLNRKYCAICEKSVFPERDFSTGALLILLLLGIIPGLIYYAVKNKTCPICKHDQWEVPPSEK